MLILYYLFHCILKVEQFQTIELLTKIEIIGNQSLNMKTFCAFYLALIFIYQNIIS